MASILVVDDSPVDRRIVAGILESDASLHVQFSENGLAAIQQIERSPPDIVVTDLVMPELDGLQLVETVRKQHRQVPVVLMTSQGSADTAVRALQLGAASYVPKTRLADRLLDTLRQVLALKSVDHPYRGLLRCLDVSVNTFHLKSELSLIPQVVDLVQRALASMGVCDATESIRLSLALEEALLNALVHGNFELTSEFAKAGFNPRADCFARRGTEPPFKDRKIFVQIELSSSQARFVVKDEGPGFSVAALPALNDLSALEQGGGRGFRLMRSFMDQVVHNESGNEVTLVKRFESASG